MFDIGDKIAHPMHGGCVIEAIAEERISGVLRKYYVLKTPKHCITVKIPVETSANVGIRPIISPQTAESILESFVHAETVESASWNKRYRDNMDKLKSGDLYEVAGVIKRLMSRENAKGLSSGERKLLASAKQILISELVLSQNSTYEEIEERIDCCCKI